MRCTECGRSIPYQGRICPYCHSPKGAEKAALAVALIGGIIGGVAGWLVFGTWLGLTGGIGVCGILPAALVRAAHNG